MKNRKDVDMSVKHIIPGDLGLELRSDTNA